MYTAGGNGQDIYFIGSSFLYFNGSSATARLFNIDGYKLHLVGCHIEVNNPTAALDAAIEVTGANGVFDMQQGYLAVGASGSTQYGSLINLNGTGSNVCGVILDSVYLDVYVSSGYLVNNAGNALSFIHTARLDIENPGGVISIISPFTNVMIDGGFENPSYVLDNIYVSADAGGITGRLASSTVSAALSAAQYHSGAQSLAVRKTGAASTTGTVSIVIPIRPGERPFFELWALCSQSFNIDLRWYALLWQGGVNGYTTMSLSQLTDIADATLSATSWTKINPGSFALGGGYYSALPTAPAWATHFAIVLDLWPVNNGTLYIDDLKVNIVK